jgi:hypothetical protein
MDNTMKIYPRGRCWWWLLLTLKGLLQEIKIAKSYVVG